MTGLGPYVRIQLDESFLDKAFKQVEVKLDRHEEMILELQKLLRDKADRTELQQLQEALLNEINSRFNDINNQLIALDSKYEERFKQMEESFENRLVENANMVQLSMRQKLDDLEDKIPQSDENKIDALIARVENAEENISSNGKKLQLTRSSVQQIATSIATLNSTQANLDNTLPDTLNKSIKSVKDQFSDLYNEIEKLKDKQQIQSIMERQTAPPPPLVKIPEKTKDTPPPEIVKPQVAQSPRDSTSINKTETTIVKQEPPIRQMQSPRVEKTVIYRETTTPDYDLTEIHPYPSMTVHWRDPPDLPAIRPFVNIGEVVDYVYRLVPKLQAHLYAMHGKVVENTGELTSKVDKSLVEKMFEKFQNVIAEMKNHVDDLKEAVEQTATRDEINDIIEDLFNSLNCESQTAIGRVKCIACGREIQSVAGALTEQEAARLLGNAPNSYVQKMQGGSPPIGISYTNKDGFDSAIVESPKSVRPYKPSYVSKGRKSPR